MNHHRLHRLAYQSLIDLATEEGINASGQTEAYGCIFGRDSAITVLKILRAHSHHPSPKLLEISRRTLLTLASLQGKTINQESGEEPGKFIHELRRSKYEHLLAGEKPWFVYPDGILRNYDSIDSTPLGLIAFYKYWQTTWDDKFLLTVLPIIKKGLLWIMTYGDKDKDSFLEYDFPPTRKFGGLVVQSWTDSHESILNAKGRMPKYPIAPIEAQSFAWLALKLWADFYTIDSYEFAQTLKDHAKKLKDRFNKKFIFPSQGFNFGAQALDGNNKQVKTITANPLLCLWAAYEREGNVESILDKEFTEDFVRRAFLPDLFVKDAGIRTMSSLSSTFNPNQDSYHNGSFWPVLNGLIVEGLENFGFISQAEKLKKATLLPLEYFGYPIELYIKNEVDNSYCEYLSSGGQTSCHEQAWSAATLLDLTSENERS